MGKPSAHAPRSAQLCGCTGVGIRRAQAHNDVRLALLIPCALMMLGMLAHPPLLSPPPSPLPLSPLHFSVGGAGELSQRGQAIGGARLWRIVPRESGAQEDGRGVR